MSKLKNFFLALFVSLSMLFNFLPAPILAQEITSPNQYYLDYDKFLSAINYLTRTGLLKTSGVRFLCTDGALLYDNYLNFDVSQDDDGSVVLSATEDEIVLHSSDVNEYVYMYTQPDMFSKDNLGIVLSSVDLDWGIFKQKEDEDSTLMTMFANQVDLSFVNMSISLNEIYPVSTERMFYLCNNLREIRGLDCINTENVMNTSGTFLGCESLVSLDIRNWDLCNVVNMESMFANCSNLAEIQGLSDLNPKGELTNISSLFYDCKKLESIDLSTWNLNNVLNASSTFSTCNALQTVDICGWNMENVESLRNMFYGDLNLQTIYNNNSANISDELLPTPITTMFNMAAPVLLAAISSPDVMPTLDLSMLTTEEGGVFTEHTHTYTLQEDVMTNVLSFTPATYSLGDTVTITTSSLTNDNGYTYTGVFLVSENGHTIYLEADESNVVSFTAEVGRAENYTVEPLYQDLSSTDDDEDDNNPVQKPQEDDDDLEQPTEEKTEIIIEKPVEQTEETEAEEDDNTSTETINTGITPANYVVMAACVLILLIVAFFVKKIIYKNKH